MASLAREPPSRPAMASAWKWYLTLGVTLAVVYMVLPASTAKLVIWPMIGWSSVVAIVVGTRRNRPTSPAAWYLLAAGVATFVVGDNLYSFREYVLHTEGLFPSFVDVVYLAVYPLLIAGLSMMVRRRTSGKDRASLIDASIITAGLGLIAWVFLIAPYVRSDDLSWTAQAASIAYPLGDVALLAIAVRLAVGGGRRPTAFWLLAGSIVALIVADCLYGYFNLAGTWYEHNPVDIAWIVFYVGWGAAALHPSMTQLTLPTETRRGVSARRLVLVASVALVSPAVLFAEQTFGRVQDAAAIALLGAFTFVLVMIRISDLARGVADERSEARFRALIDNASDAIVVLDADGVAIYAAPSSERVLGRPAGVLVGRPFAELLETGDAEQLALLLAGGTSSTNAEWTVRHTDGGRRELEVIAANMRDVNGVDGLVLTMRDITDRKHLDAELRRRALHDDLTNLPNRALFVDRVGHALGRSSRRPDSVGVLLMDLDDFSLVNDNLGHSAGDELLISLAERLTSLMRPGDTVARFGGDEFALLVESDDLPAGIELLAERIQTAFREPFTLRAGQSLQPRASIGLAVGSSDTHSSDELLRNADVAMHVAKNNGDARAVTFTPAMYDDARRRIEIAAELEGVVERGELRVYYQAIVDIHTGRTLGAEALMRWQHPTRGLVSPDDFIPIAESNGSIVALGRWILEEACAQTQRWKSEGSAGPGFYVTVNLSARHIQDPNVVGDVLDVLARTQLAAGSLVLEVTETTLLLDHAAAASTLTALKGLGVRIAVDDFGTGYSSLAYLRAFPLDVIKIDKSFIDQLVVSPEGAAIVRAVIDLAEALGLQTVAEGVESREQRTALEHLGCKLAQGFLFARPVPAIEMATKLKAPLLATRT
jgi:diguanylate cyclase (GGDEF)-like protein/PAS domain S-box-containing protein